MTEPLPSGLVYGTVSWWVVGPTPDSLDIDALPENDLINGTAIFEVDPDYIQVTGGDSPSFTILPKAQRYAIVNGHLQDEQGRRVITMIGNDSPYMTQQGWPYRVTWELDDGYTFGSYIFYLPGNTHVDLTDEIPLITDPGNPGVIITKGSPGETGPPGPGYGGGIVVAPTDFEQPLTLEIVSNWGIDSAGNAYYDPDGAAPDEAAMLVPDYEGNAWMLFRPGPSPTSLTLDQRVEDLVLTANSATRVALESSLEASLGVPEKTGGTIMRRYPDGSVEVSALYIGDGTGNTAVRESTGSTSANPNTWVIRSASGATQLNQLDITAAAGPSIASHATRKDYVDNGLAGKAATIHTHTASQISDFTEAVQDTVGAFFGAGTGASVTYNDAANTITVSATGTSDPEAVRDAIGAALIGVGNITVTVNDAGDTITISTTATVNRTDSATDTLLAAKAPTASPTFTGTVSGVTAAMVGLGNVNNTADSAKPVSTAQQTALDLKANLASPTFTGTVSGITKSMVGLANVDNTSDASKPVSTAQATALSGKANTSHSHPVGDLTATGTKDATTFLRGDNVWAVPAGSGGGGSSTGVGDDQLMKSLYGLKGWSFDPLLASATQAMTSGTLYVSRMIVVPGDVLTAFEAQVTAVGSSVTLFKGALYAQDGTLLRSTASITPAVGRASGNWQSAGADATYTVPAGVTWLYVGVIAVATTAPTLARSQSPGSALIVQASMPSGVRSGTRAGQTDVPSPLGTPAASNLSFFQATT